MASSGSRFAFRIQIPILMLVLFVAYFCVAMSLPIVPAYVGLTLGYSHAWGGLAVGAVFLSTIVSRGWAGSLSDRRGSQLAATLGLICYAVGALTAMATAICDQAGTALAVLLVGRLITGIGESLVGVAIIGWGIGLLGANNAGRVMAWVGAAMYGGMACGGPAGFWLYEHFGYLTAMAISGVLPLFAMTILLQVPTVPKSGKTLRPSMRGALRLVSLPGIILCLQGVGFAGIGAFFALSFQERGWEGAGFGLTAFGCGFVLVRLLFGGLPDRIGGIRVAAISLGVEAAGQALLWTAPIPALGLLGAFMTGLGCSLIFPGLGREVVQRVSPEMRGTALGAFSAFQDLAYGLTGPLAGLLADRAGYDAVFILGMCAALSGLLIALKLQLSARNEHSP